jgi:hypothetical protein
MGSSVTGTRGTAAAYAPPAPRVPVHSARTLGREVLLEMTMNSAWKQFLAVLGLNILVTAVLAMAFSSYLFKEDPFLVAIPSVIALPALILQPWFLLFALLPVGPILGPIPTSIVTVLLYRRLDRRGLLERPKRLLRRVTKRGALRAGAAVVALTLLGLFARHIDVPPIHRQPRQPTCSGNLRTWESLPSTLGATRCTHF